MFEVTLPFRLLSLEPALSQCISYSTCAMLQLHVTDRQTDRLAAVSDAGCSHRMYKVHWSVGRPAGRPAACSSGTEVDGRLIIGSRGHDEPSATQVH